MGCSIVKLWSAAAAALFALAALALLLWLLLGPQATPQIESIQTPLLGKTLFVEVLPEDGGLARTRAALSAAVRQAQSVEILMSSDDMNSDIARLNAAPAHQNIPMSADTLTLLNVARRYYDECKHSFDITLAPIIDLWNQAQHDQTLPTDAQLLSVRNGTDWHSFIFDNGSVRKKNAQSRINLNAVAKGYAIDRVVQTLKTAGIDSGSVQIDSNIRVFGSHPPFGHKQLPILNPFDITQEITQYAFQNAAVGTSGNRARFITINGQNYSHLIDPRTLKPTLVSASVTVVAPSAIAADAWATALAVLGPQGFALLPSDVAAFMISGTPQSMQISCNQRFASLLSSTPENLQIRPQSP